MGKIDNLDASHVDEIWDAIKLVQKSSPIGFSSVSHGALHIMSEEGLIVSGSASVSGKLDVTGKIEVFGPDGQVIVHGTLHSDGPVTFDDTLVVKAETTLGQDGAETHIVGPANLGSTLTIDDDGLVNVGESMVLDPTEDGGAILIGTAKLSGVEGAGMGMFDAGGATVQVGDGYVQSGIRSGDDLLGLTVDSGGWQLRGPGEILGEPIEATFSKLTTTGEISLGGLPTISGVVPNLYLDPADNKLKRIV